MSSYSKMYWIWLTKHVLDCYGDNVQQYYWSNGAHLPKCESSGTHNEYTMHICQCKDTGRNGLFHITMRELYTWMVKTLGNCAVASTVEVYLLARGNTAMQTLMHSTSIDMSVVCKKSNHLGWDSLLEGRISSHWLVLISPLLRCQSKNLLPFCGESSFFLGCTTLCTNSGCTGMRKYTSRERKGGQCHSYRTLLTKSTSTL
jgi:hypothetical protein